MFFFVALLGSTVLVILKHLSEIDEVIMLITDTRLTSYSQSVNISGTFPYTIANQNDLLRNVKTVGQLY